MQISPRVVTFLLTIPVLSGAMYFAAAGPPDWAYGFEPASVGSHPPPPSPPNDAMRKIPGTDLTFTRAHIQDRFAPADWFPGDHPEMPAIVATGRKPDVWACGLCHYPNGKGRPENAGVSGLPVSYFIEQMHSFRDGDRNSADPRKGNTKNMIAFAKNMTDAEIQQAADYYGAIKWTTPWIRVVETKTVPKSYTSVGMLLPLENGGTEPIGERVIEMPVHPEETEVLRNPHSGFIAYAPMGSLAKGKKLVTTGAGKTEPCAICHGEGLRGLGPVPSIAGRSPSYIGRQLYDLQQGTRKGGYNELMKAVVQNLSPEDVVDVAAYTASLAP